MEKRQSAQNEVFRTAEHLGEVVEVELLLRVVGEKRDWRREAEQPLPPTELLTRHEQTEQPDQPVNYSSFAHGPSDSNGGCGREEQRRPPLDDAVFLHRRRIPIRRAVREGEHADDPAERGQVHQQRHGWPRCTEATRVQRTVAFIARVEHHAVTIGRRTAVVQSVQAYRPPSTAPSTCDIGYRVG